MHSIAALILSCSLVASAGEVRVFAAASLTRTFTAAQQHLGTSMSLNFNFAGSQQLALQLSQGAKADAFVSADERWMRDVEGHDLLAGPARLFARNKLVVVTPPKNPGHVDTLADLARPGVKLVLAADAVPAGRYSREALAKIGEKGGLGADFRERVLKNVVSEEENVEAVVTKVQLGEADAGIVYVTDVVGERRDKLHSIAVPDDANAIASYFVAVLKSAPNPEGARAFVAWLGSDDGKTLLAEQGFLPGD